MHWLELALYYLIAINFVAFAAFGWDKAQAERGGWRVREMTLVTLASVGGIAGALAGRAVFRHKTRKPAFLGRMVGGAIALPLLGLAVWYFAPDLRSRDPQEQARLEQVMASVHYAGCHEVRAAGKAPLHYGDPGYGPHMDGDGDGVACEPIP